MTYEYETTFEPPGMPGVEIGVRVEYRMTAFIRGARDSLGGVRNAGPPLEPDEYPEPEDETWFAWLPSPINSTLAEWVEIADPESFLGADYTRILDTLADHAAACDEGRDDG